METSAEYAIVQPVEEECPMGVMRVELPEDLVGPIENKASELNVDVSHFVAAIVREKLRLPVKVGELEVFVPANILEYELERAPGESDEDYEATKATFNAVFSAALK
jgi:hypothetical protein